MLKAVIIDSSAVARGLLQTVLTDGGYEVAGQAHTCPSATVLLIKHQPQIICISRDVAEADVEGAKAMRADYPKAMMFMVSSEFDTATVQWAHALGINGLIVKPFNAGTVLKTIRNTVITMVRRQQKAQAAAAGQSEESGGDEA